MTTAEKLARLNELRQANGKTPLKSWKSSGEKLDLAIQAEGGDATDPSMPMGENGNQLVDSTDDFQMSDEELAKQQGRQTTDETTSAPEEPEQQTGGQPEQPSSDEPKSERGAIGRLVISLLVDTDDDYATIVGKVREAHPEAKTTARSIASIAADLRRDGVDVKSRRKAKKVAAD